MNIEEIDGGCLVDAAMMLWEQCDDNFSSLFLVGKQTEIDGRFVLVLIGSLCEITKLICFLT